MTGRDGKDGVWLNGPVPMPRFKLTPRPRISPSQSHHISLFSVPSRARPFPCAALLWLQFCGIGSSFLRLFLSASVLRKGGDREGSHAFAWLLLLGCLFFETRIRHTFCLLGGRIDCSLFVAVVGGWGGGRGGELHWPRVTPYPVLVDWQSS